MILKSLILIVLYQIGEMAKKENFSVNLKPLMRKVDLSIHWSVCIVVVECSLSG